jgi:hypothetical protein
MKYYYVYLLIAIYISYILVETAHQYIEHLNYIILWNYLYSETKFAVFFFFHFIL